ncbi:nuclear transport factor 2 family protein [Nocardia sp. NPDC003482]
MDEGITLDAWRSGDTAGVVARLAEDAVFSSPVADYHGRANVAHMLGLIATVLDEVAETGRWHGAGDELFAFAARAAGGELQGLVREEFTEDGRLAHVTLFLRPLRALRAAIATMAARLEDSPLPQPGA